VIKIIKFISFTNLKIIATTIYKKPATTIPPKASGREPVSDIARIGGIKAKEEPRNTGILNFVQ